MNIKKIIWSVRAVAYKLFTKVGLPGYIGKPVFINNLKNVLIGKKVRIYPGLRAETFGTDGKIIFGDNVSVGQNFHIIANEEPLKIGNNVVISGNVFITNCDHSYTEINKFLYDQQLKTAHTEIGDYSFIGYGAVIQAGTVLGKQCVVGSNSVVRGVFPDYSVIVGAPARVVKQYNPQKKLWEKV